MKKTSILLMGLGVVALSLASSTRLYAQRGPVQIGDTATYIVPAGVYTSPTIDLVITGPAQAPKAVGDCVTKGSTITDPGLVGAAKMPTSVAFYDADIVPRKQINNVWLEQAPTGKTTVAMIFPGYMGFTDLKQGWHIGHGRDGGKCGPGYEIFIMHVIAGLPGPQNQFFEMGQKK